MIRYSTIKLYAAALALASSVAAGGAMAQTQTTGNQAVPTTAAQGANGAVSPQGQYNAQAPAAAEHPTAGMQTRGPNGAVSGDQPAK